MRILTGQLTAIAADTTITATIEGKARHGIPTILNAHQTPVLRELWVFLVEGTTIVGLGPSYNWPA